ncbi:MAG: tRNA (adenosine(37)-N6)-threonylcarbamoyltransferase complex transferase subunit TsaD [Clostridiales bacterium]|jgi:N6-L-threonylcarbamoyladenine synthase|nr:tRNA (adenosine(37)-N6)-threonylcarbamoyltransferase complex transferase subunit TsaD [Clostridiales bacterium]
MIDLAAKKNITVLAIESSCDETAAAVVVNARDVLSNVIASQIEVHRRFGGVVPEVASRNHTLALPGVVDRALSLSGLELSGIDAIAVTYGAGLLGALLTGVAYAKGLSYASGIPLVAVSHVKGHIAANYLAHPDLEFPYICVLASGGHSAIVNITDYDKLETLGSTLDDAAGEAFDKVARVLGLPYPGGPEIQRLAREGKPCIDFGRPLKNRAGFDFSFSGLKTAVINYTANNQKNGYSKADAAASFELAAASHLADNAVRAALAKGVRSIALSGGVGANIKLRELLTNACAPHGIKTYFLPLGLCTDNAAMIAAEAYFMIRKGKAFAGLELDAQASLKII